MKIIFLSDIVGKIGRQAVIKQLPKLKKEFQADLVIANVENLAHGMGFTHKTLAEIFSAGVDICTSGNHAWEKGGTDDILDDPETKVIRPANYSSKKSGSGWQEITVGQNKLIVVNLLGKVFIDEEVACPFKTLEKILAKFKDLPVVVDFHAEATSEKAALANYFDGRISAVIGTHTHVQTSDERILEEGTGFITDAGMIGYYDSVIGARKDQVFNLFLNKGISSKKHDLPDSGKALFNGVYLEINPKTKKTVKIERINKIIEIK